MTPDALAALVSASVTDLIEDNKLCLPKGYRVNATVERPKNREHGDYATNVAMTLAKPAHTPPRFIGEMLAAQLSLSPAIAHAEVAGPGFVNITLEAASQGEVASRIVIEGAHYGQGTSQHGRWINIEFISANPTGPIHLGHTRWAAVGDAIARVLAAQGAVGDPRVLHQRPRRADGALRRVDHERRARPPGPRGRATTAATSRTSPRRSSPTTPASRSCPSTSSR